jgi:hypothetical protein
MDRFRLITSPLAPPGTAYIVDMAALETFEAPISFTSEPEWSKPFDAVQFTVMTELRVAQGDRPPAALPAPAPRDYHGTHRVSRRVQPYRKGAREPGAALTAMTRGRDFQGGNPQDAVRRVQMLMRAGKAQNGQPRGPRPARPARPAR